MPKVSVIINCHNGEEYLEECLNSIKKQTFQDYEIVFWDNCSTDRSAQIAKSFEKVIYFRGEKLIPLGAARNKALEKAKGKYIAYIDCDDLWDKEKIERQVEELECNDDVGMVLTNYRRHNMMTDKTIVVYKDTEKRKVGFADLIMKYHFCLSSFMIRKNAMEELDHLFNNEFRYAEEFELFSRIAYKWKTSVLPEPLVTYRIHKSMNTMLLQERKSAEYGMILDSLRKMAPEIDKEYPEVIRWITFVKDLNEAKTSIIAGENKKVKTLMRQYRSYNFRADCYYMVSFLPPRLSKWLVKVFYAKRY